MENDQLRMASSGMLHCVAPVRSNVLEELSTSSTIRVTRISELGTLAITSNRRRLCVSVAIYG
jgi:hypothetical protein